MVKNDDIVQTKSSIWGKEPIVVDTPIATFIFFSCNVCHKRVIIEYSQLFFIYYILT